MMNEKVKAAYHEGRQSMKSVIADTVRKLVEAQNKRDELEGELQVMSIKFKEVEEMMRQKDAFINALMNSGSEEVAMQLKQALEQLGKA